jgi:hypothetical protein
MAQPQDQIVRFVMKHPGDVRTASEISQRRPRVSRRASDARHHVTRAATVRLNQRWSPGRIGTFDPKSGWTGFPLGTAGQADDRQHGDPNHPARSPFRGLQPGHEQNAEGEKVDQTRGDPHEQTAELLVLERR